MSRIYPPPLMKVEGFPLLSSGKVRDIIDLGNGFLLIISTDRLSAYDVILPDGVYLRGYLLNQLSAHWFRNLPASVIGKHHLVSTNPQDFPEPLRKYGGRAMLVRKADSVFPVECVVRGCIDGSGWQEYLDNNGIVCGIQLPRGLKQGDVIPDGPIFTAATKAPAGSHDENITFEQMCSIVGTENAEALRSKSLAIYKSARIAAISARIIIADTKFEFGLHNGEIMLVDEALTPDSSRFWPLDQYKPGGPQVSFDKQFVRDYLTGLFRAGKWDKKAPGPNLPAEVIELTRQKYLDAFLALTGTPLAEAA